MGLDFVKNYGGIRLEGGSPLPDQLNAPSNDEEEGQQIRLDIEFGLGNWSAIQISNVDGWRPDEWTIPPFASLMEKMSGKSSPGSGHPKVIPFPFAWRRLAGLRCEL
jgi:hypothetical protein